MTKARGFFEKALGVMTRVMGVEHPDTLTSMNNLAVTLRYQGDLAAARTLLKQVIEVRTRVLGAEHPDTMFSELELLTVVSQQNDTTEADALIRSLSRLLDRDPAQLSARENQIRQNFIQLLEKRTAGDASEAEPAEQIPPP